MASIGQACPPLSKDWSRDGHPVEPRLLFSNILWYQKEGTARASAQHFGFLFYQKVWQFHQWTAKLWDRIADDILLAAMFEAIFSNGMKRD